MSHIDEGRLHAWLDGALDAEAPALAAEVAAHLEGCRDCRARLEAVQRVRAEAASILESAEPEGLETPPFDEVLARSAAARAQDGAAGTADDAPAPAGAAGAGRPLADAPVHRDGGERRGSADSPARRRRRVRAALPLAWAASVALAVAAGWWAHDIAGPDAAAPMAERTVDRASTRVGADGANAPADTELPTVASADDAGAADERGGGVPNDAARGEVAAGDTPRGRVMAEDAEPDTVARVAADPAVAGGSAGRMSTDAADARSAESPVPMSVRSAVPPLPDSLAVAGMRSTADAGTVQLGGSMTMGAGQPAVSMLRSVAPLVVHDSGAVPLAGGSGAPDDAGAGGRALVEAERDRARAGDAADTRGVATAVRSAVLAEVLRRVDHQRTASYCVSVLEADPSAGPGDPSAELLSGFAGHRPEVLAASGCARRAGERPEIAGGYLRAIMLGPIEWLDAAETRAIVRVLEQGRDEDRRAFHCTAVRSDEDADDWTAGCASR